MHLKHSVIFGVTLKKDKKLKRKERTENFKIEEEKKKKNTSL